MTYFCLSYDLDPVTFIDYDDKIHTVLRRHHCDILDSGAGFGRRDHEGDLPNDLDFDAIQADIEALNLPNLELTIAEDD